jgi:hypothetical protein
MPEVETSSADDNGGRGEKKQGMQKQKDKTGRVFYSMSRVEGERNGDEKGRRLLLILLDLPINALPSSQRRKSDLGMLAPDRSRRRLAAGLYQQG